MKFSKDNKYFPIAVLCVITVALCAVIVLVVINFQKIPQLLSSLLSIVSPFLYGFFIAYICNPIMKFLENNVFKFKGAGKKFSRPLALTVSVLFLLFIISLIFIIVIPQLYQSYNDLAKNFNSYIEKAQEFADDFVKNFWLFNGKYENLYDFLNANDIATDLKALIDKAGSLLTSIADYIITHAVNFVVEIKNIIMGIIISIYFLLSKDVLSAQMKKLLASFMPRRRYLNAVNLGRFANKTVGGFISGKILDSIIIGFLSFVVFTIFRLPYTPLISVIVGVTNVIPFFGPIIGAIPCAFILLIADPPKMFLFIVLILIIQQLDGNVIGPHILGDSTGLSALGVLVAITIGGGLFGLVGMFLGVPAYAVIREVITQNLDRRLVKRSMPKSLDFYASDPAQADNNFNPLFIDKDTAVEQPFVDYSDAYNDDSVDEEPHKKESRFRALIKKIGVALKKLFLKIAALFRKKK